MDRPIPKKKWTLKRIGMIGIPSAFILFVLSSLLFGDRRSQLNVQAERLTVSTVSRAPFQEFIPVTGTVIPIKTVFLDAMEGGQVSAVYLEAGSLVKAGDKILKLENNNLRLNILYNEANLAEQSNALRTNRLQMEQNRLALQSQLTQLNYELKKQKRIYEQSKILIEKGMIARQQFEEEKDLYDFLVEKQRLTIETHQKDSLFRTIQIQNLEMSLDRMQDNMRLVKLNLENLVVKAPVSGQLTSLVPEVGQSISGGQRIGQIDVLDGFKARAEIDEHYIARIHTELGGEFEFAGKTYRLGIRKVYPEVKEGRFEVDMEFESGSPESIRRGQTLHIRLELGDLSEAVLLPRGGFNQTTGGQWIYVVDQSGNFAVKRAIKLGRQNPEMFEVLEGLEPGEKAITSSYESYGEMDKLILKK
ncbi:HlyD family efflux transporter periplasmic adaptor subunit [bacterium]|nr:HlyD family efflux transporter periplasmic adaptor subunit [bacterium]